MSRSKLNIVICTQEDNLVYVIPKNEYAVQNGDIIRDFKSWDTVHWDLIDMLKHNTNVKELDLSSIFRMLSSEQISILRGYSRKICVHVNYHMYPDGTCVYALSFKDPSNKENRLYVSEKLKLYKFGIQRVIERALKVLQKKLNIDITVVSVTDFNNFPTEILKPWEYDMEMLRLSDVCQNIPTPFPYKNINL